MVPAAIVILVAVGVLAVLFSNAVDRVRSLRRRIEKLEDRLDQLEPPRNP